MAVHPAPGMTAVAVAIAVIWAALLFSAYATRVMLRRSKRFSAATVIATYLVLAAAIVSWYGPNSIALLSVTGMLVPCLVALVAIQLDRRNRA